MTHLHDPPGRACLSPIAGRSKCWGIDLAGRGVILYDLKGKDGLDTNQVLKQLLEEFQKHEIFVYAALDEDGGGDHIRTLKRMASQGTLSAGFSIWTPDFESHNFSMDELAVAATKLARDNHMEVDFTAAELQDLMQTRNLPAGKAVERLASAKTAYMVKGPAWGRALAGVACADDAEAAEEISNEKGERPATAMLEMLIRGHDADYTLSVEHTIAQHGNPN